MSTEMYVELGVRSCDNDQLIGKVLRGFDVGLPVIQSAELDLPGREVFRFPWSIDNSIGSKRLFPGETIGHDGISFVDAANVNFLSHERQKEILEHIRQFQQKANIDYARGQAVANDLCLRFWGPCRLAYRHGQRLGETWILREKLSTGETAPVCRFSCSFATKPIQEFGLLITSQSRLWSKHHQCNNYTQHRDLGAERHNAQSLANALVSLGKLSAEASVRWAVGGEGIPDLLGFIPDELRAKLGEPQVFHSIGDIPAS